MGVDVACLVLDRTALDLLWICTCYGLPVSTPGQGFDTGCLGLRMWVRAKMLGCHELRAVAARIRQGLRKRLAIAGTAFFGSESRPRHQVPCSGRSF